VVDAAAGETKEAAAEVDVMAQGDRLRAPSNRCTTKRMETVTMMTMHCS
jgi:hypothetical protein